MAGSVDEASAMARAVKQARGALVEAVRRDLGSALRAAHSQVFESLDPGGTRLTELADRAQMSHQAMGELVDELTRLGYVERIADPDDGRARLVRATTRGRRELGRAAEQLRLLHDRWERELDGVTVSQVVDALEALIRICGPAGHQPAARRTSSS